VRAVYPVFHVEVNLSPLNEAASDIMIWSCAEQQPDYTYTFNTFCLACIHFSYFILYTAIYLILLAELACFTMYSAFSYSVQCSFHFVVTIPTHNLPLAVS